MKIEYRALAAMSWVLRIVAVLMLIGGLFIGIDTGFSWKFDWTANNDLIRVPPTALDRNIGLGVIFMTILITLALFASAELIRIQIANARQIATQTALLARIEKHGQRPLDGLRELRG